MSSIQEILASISDAVFGKDVRQAIHDGVEMAYNKADNAETSAAAAADAASGSQNSAAASAQAASNSASSASNSANQAEQYKNEAFHTTPAGYEAFVGEVNSSLGYLAKTGVQNILDSPNIAVAPLEQNGITVTPNGDGTYTVNGTATANVLYYLTTVTDDFNGLGLLKISGTPSGGSEATYCTRIYNSQGNAVASDIGQGNTFTGASQMRVAIVIFSGTTVNNLVFKPMITFNGVLNSDYAHFVRRVVSNADLFPLYGLISANHGVYNKNLNDINDDSVYYCNTSATNRPVNTGWGFCITFVFDSNSAMQIFLSLTGTDSNTLFSRVKVSGYWGDWREYTGTILS